MNSVNGYHLRPEEESYIRQTFEREFLAFRSYITQPILEEEQLSNARYFLARITDYHERLSKYLAEPQVDTLMFSVYMHILDQEQATRKKPKRPKP